MLIIEQSLRYILTFGTCSPASIAHSSFPGTRESARHATLPVAKAVVKEERYTSGPEDPLR